MTRPTTLERFRRIVQEAHRRSLGQVLAVYGVASWVGYEVILGLTEGIGLPDWVPALAVVLFIIGLPLVLATAFVQEGPPTQPRRLGTAVDHRGGALHAGDAAPAGRSRTPPDGAGRPGPPPSRHLTWRRTARAGALTFGLFAIGTSGFMGMRALGIGPAGTLVAKGELEAREPLVVADFDGLTGDSSLAMVVAEGLRADLAQSPFVTTADRSRVRETLALMLRPANARLDATTAREVAIRMGLKAVVEGEVGRVGSGYLLTARVVTADSGRTLAAFRETAPDSTALLSAIEGLSRSLRERVGESLRTVRASAPLAQVTTASLPALRKAAGGWWEEAHLNRPRAIRLLSEAVEMDPGFASAWIGLAIIHYNRGDREPALHAIRQALENEDRLDEISRHRARALFGAITGDHRMAESELREMAALVPAEPLPHNLLSDNAWNRGAWAEAAAHARRALELGSTSWVAHWNLVVALLDGGQVDEARVATDRAAAALPGARDIPRQLRDMVLAAGGRYDSIHALNGDVPFRAAFADRTLGRLAEAERHSGEAGNPYMGTILHAVHRMLIVGDPEAADWLEARVDSLAAAGSGAPERSIAELGVALAMVGRVDAARLAADRYRERVPEEGRWADAFLLHAIDAFVALAQDRGDDALADLRRARAATPWTAPVDALLGRAFDTLGRPDSAIAAYERYLATPWADRLGFFNTFSDPLLLAPVHERLAYLHEEAGNAGAAALHGGAVLFLWKDADPAVQGRVRAIQGLLERVTDEASAER